MLDRLNLEMETYETKDKALDVLYQIVERSQALFIPVVCVCGVCVCVCVCVCVLERRGGFTLTQTL